MLDLHAFCSFYYGVSWHMARRCGTDMDGWLVGWPFAFRENIIELV